MKKIAIMITSLVSFGISSNVMAHGDEGHMHDSQVMESMGGHEHMGGMGHNPCGMKEGSFLKKEVIDGYDVSFHIIKAPEGMSHGGTHHVMIKVEKNNKVMVLKAVNSKVTHPNGNSESKMMMKMGDWYMVGYDLDHGGDHKVMVLFKTEDDKKHFAGMTYPSK